MRNDKALDTIGEILCRNVRILRKKRGWTQADLAEKAKIPLRTFQNIELGLAWPELHNLETIARALGIHPCALFLTEGVEVLPTIEEALAVLDHYVHEARARESVQSPRGELSVEAKEKFKSLPEDLLLSLSELDHEDLAFIRRVIERSRPIRRDADPDGDAPKPRQKNRNSR